MWTYGAQSLGLVMGSSLFQSLWDVIGTTGGRVIGKNPRNPVSVNLDKAGTTTFRAT